MVATRLHLRKIVLAEVYDNKFDPKYLHDIFATLQGKLRYRACNVANATTWPYHQEGSHRLFGSTIFARHHPNIISYLDNENAPTSFKMFEFLCRIKNLDSTRVYLNRIDVNLQHSGCDGTLHIDSNGPTDRSQHTIMVMPNPIWEKEWGGKFQIFSEDRSEMLEEYEYVPGRIIVFPSHYPHRGLGPTKEYMYRYSIVFGLIL